MKRQSRLTRELTTLKSEIKQYRRQKNKEALDYKKKEAACEQLYTDIKQRREKQLQFSIASYTAKLGEDKELAMRYWLCEALAKVQDVDPTAIWDKYSNVADIRNTVVVELTQILGVSVESVQAMMDIELVQQVDDL